MPAGALISGLLSWRWTFVLLAGLSLIFAAILFRSLPKTRPERPETPKD